MRECEMLVIASPIYYYSLTRQTHCASERVYAFERLPKLKKAALLLTAAGGGPLQSRLTRTQLSDIWAKGLGT